MKDEGNNVISTRKWENTLLKLGESVDAQATLIWINGNNNLELVLILQTCKKTMMIRMYQILIQHSDKNFGDFDIDDATALLSVASGRGKNFRLN